MIAKLAGGQLLAEYGDDYVIHTAQLTEEDLASDEALILRRARRSISARSRRRTELRA